MSHIEKLKLSNKIKELLDKSLEAKSKTVAVDILAEVKDLVQKLYLEVWHEYHRSGTLNQFQSD